MSWLGGYKSKSSELDAKEEKRKKLEEERKNRLLRTKQRADRQKQLEAAIEAQRQADQACQDLLSIDLSLFEGDEDAVLSDSEVEALLAPDIMTDFDQENGTDDEKAMDNLRSVHCPFNKEDIPFWFSQLEDQLTLIGVKAQWTKKIALVRFLPADMVSEVKSLMTLSKTAAGTDIYFRIKKELLDLFGPKPEDAYIKAKNRIMSGKPSQMGKLLVEDICSECAVKMSGCCAKIVWGMFREKLPIVIRNHIADLPFNKDTYRDVFKKADQVWDSNRDSEPRPTVAAVKVDQTTESGGDVAAVSFRGRGRGRGQRGGRGQGRGRGGNNNQSRSTTPNAAATAAPSTSSSDKPKGTRHPTAKGKDENLCKLHFNWGVNANYCAAPWKCPMKDTWTAPQ